MALKDSFLNVVFEFCNQNLYQQMQERSRQNKPYSNVDVRDIMFQAISAVAYVHRNGYMHRDIKPENFLVTEASESNKSFLKLADFGLATKLDFPGDRKHTVCGTPNYIAPEIIMSSMGKGHSGHSYEVDIWSTGVILYLMLVGKPPFETNKL